VICEKISAFCDPLERELVYACNRKCWQAKIEWLLPPALDEVMSTYYYVATRAGSRCTTSMNQTGGIKMRNRVAWYLVGIVLVFVLALAGIGYMVASTHGGLRGNGTAQASTSQDKTVFGVTQVSMRHDLFSPMRIQVVLGTTVTWTNQDTVSHNVTFAPVVMTSSNNWESGLLSPGQSFSYTFTSQGTFQYHCQEDPGMVGVVIVT
jgi:plastocyanin